MKRTLLFLALMLSVSYAFAQTKQSEEQLQAKSNLSEPGVFANPTGAGPEDTSFPRFFDEINQQTTPSNAAISTGYYFMNSDESFPGRPVFQAMIPKPKYVDTTYEPQLWRRIISGPRVLPKDYWYSSSNQEGFAFFRNPADGGSDETFWTDPKDSTDDAIAGPIPLGIKGGFYFNGIRYDSFYVSANGVIALTNRRYFYDANGQRVIPAGATSCYDPMSMDWFAGGIRMRDTLWVRNWNNTSDSLNPSTMKKIPVTFVGCDGLTYVRTKDGLTDPNPDNFGYLFSVLGANPQSIGSFDRTNALGGIRKRGGPMNSIPTTSKSAIIAPLWLDGHLSQWDEDNKKKDDHGKVFYKRTFTGDSLIIGFYNYQPKGTIYATTYGTYNYTANRRPGANYIQATFQVVLASNDSSVNIHYNFLTGRLDYAQESYAYNIFRYNATSGVRGFARHVNYGKTCPIPNMEPWAAEYEQFTTYWDRTLNANFAYPQQAPNTVKFKQWQNTLRVTDIQYRVRSQEANALNPLEFVTVIPSANVEDYELLAGHERLGAVQPIALIQNLTNEIQGPDGVNFVKQQLQFRARFRILNVITDRIVYNRIVPVDDICLGLDESNANLCNGDPTVRVRMAKKVNKSGANYVVNATDTLYGSTFTATGWKGIPPYYFALIHFPPFEPNEFIDNHIGRLKSYIIADPSNPRTGEALKDNWPFDDTFSIRMFVMKRFSDDDPDPRFQRFEDDGTQFHVDKSDGSQIPSAYKWVCINAEIVNGDVVSNHPLAPRGTYAAANEPTRRVASPVIKMNRTWGTGDMEPLAKYADSRTPARNGDELRSFPIDLRNKYNASLSISVQRVLKKDDWPRGFGDLTLVGPEPRTIHNGDPFTISNNGLTASQVPDEIVVEFAKPSDDGIKDITNITLKNWRHHPQARGSKAAAITDMAAITVYGAGGYLIGFLETQKDSALALPGSGKINSLRPTPFTKIIYDDGFDLEYKKYYVTIPDTFIRWKADGAKNFRFRVKVYATNDLKCALCISDDTDDFLVDNIKISFPAEITDIEVASVKIQWPYTIAPASQATSIPVTVKLSNNTSLDAPGFAVKVKIFRIDQLGNHIDKDPIYCRTEPVSNLNSGNELELIMPTWNARKSQVDTVGTYRIYAMVAMPETDLEPKNDTTYTDVTLRFGRVFAYDPAVEKPENNVPSFGLPGGKGLNLFGYNWDGANAGPAWDATTHATGAIGGNGSGSIAMKFELLNTDTLRGFEAYFGQMNMSSDQITFRLYEGSDLTPSSTILFSAVTTRGGVNQNIYGRYVTYNLGQTIILPRGVYWLSISQDGQTGLELGASSSRSGLRTMNTFIDPNTGEWNVAGNAFYLDKSFRRKVAGNWQNNNFFCYENVASGGGWVMFTPSTGKLGYPHLNHFGQVTDAGPTRTLTRGSWIPMLRPYFGVKTHGENAEDFQICPDDSVPVNIIAFNGKVRRSGIDLWWETASEQNNHGFFVERRVYGADDESWKQLTFVEGAGNSNSRKFYNFADENVEVKTTYQYRLRQVDFDGTQYCSTSDIVTLTYDVVGELALEQNSPNPFMNSTTIKFNVPFSQDIKLEIVDILGNVIKTLVDGNVSAGTQYASFDGTDSNGNVLSTGTYIYRLTAGETTLTGKMSLYR